MFIAQRVAWGTLATLLLRCISFACTQFTIRLVNPIVLGQTSIQLELIHATILFTSREGFRLAMTRGTTKSSGGGITATTSTTTTNWNMAWLTIPISTLLSLLALYGHLMSLATNKNNKEDRTRIRTTAEEHTTRTTEDDYRMAGILYCFAAAMEGWTEPAVLWLLRQFQPTIKAMAEGVATLTKTITIVTLLTWLQQQQQQNASSASDDTGNNQQQQYLVINRFLVGRRGSTVPIRIGPASIFGWAQIMYSLVYMTILYWYTRKDLILPQLWNIQQQQSSPPEKRGKKDDAVQANKTVVVSDSMDNNKDLSTNPRMMMTNMMIWDPYTAYLIGIFTIQGLFKHALTEGDRIVLTTLQNSYDQGIYAMGSSYGGLVARILLQPLEENARLLFSRLSHPISTTTSHTIPTTTGTTTSSSTRTKTKAELDKSPQQLSPNPNENCSQQEEQQQDQQQQQQRKDSRDDENMNRLEESYLVLVKLVLYIGLIFACFGVHYTTILLMILAGKKWGQNITAANVLSAFCFYTAFLAWNGMTESFVYGVATTHHEIQQLTLAHITIGICFTLGAPILVTWYGTIGLVMANCVAMSARALYAVYFASTYLSQSRTKKVTTTMSFRSRWQVILIRVSDLLVRMFPHGAVMIAFAFSYYATGYSWKWMQHSAEQHRVESYSMTWMQLVIQHVGVGIACLLGLLSVAYNVEQTFRRSVRSLWYSKYD